MLVIDDQSFVSEACSIVIVVVVEEEKEMDCFDW